MKQHTILNDFIKYASLNVLGMIGLSCYILADTFFISKGLGAEGLTALNLAIPVYSFIHGSGLMIGMGGGTRYSILKSQNRQKDMNQVFTNAAVAFLLPALFFFCAGLFFSAPLTHLLGANETVFEMTQTYLRVILFFAPAFMLNNLLLCFVRCSRSKFLSKLLKTFDKTFREIFPVFISTKRREKPSAFFDNNFVNNAYFSEAASSSSSHLASSSSKAPISSRMTCLCLWSS